MLAVRRARAEDKTKGKIQNGTTIRGLILLSHRIAHPCARHR